MSESHVASEERAGRKTPAPWSFRSFYKGNLFLCLLLRKEERVCILTISQHPPKKKRSGNAGPVLDLWAQYKDHSTYLLIRSGQAGWVVQNDKLERHFHVFVVSGHRKFQHFCLLGWILRVQQVTFQMLYFSKHVDTVRNILRVQEGFFCLANIIIDDQYATDNGPCYILLENVKTAVHKAPSWWNTDCLECSEHAKGQKRSGPLLQYCIFEVLKYGCFYSRFSSTVKTCHKRCSFRRRKLLPHHSHYTSLQPVSVWYSKETFRHTNAKLKIFF